MIRSIRKKFIATAMCSMALVLAAIIICINIASYLDVCDTADTRIRLIADNDGTFPQSGSQPVSTDEDAPEPPKGDEKKGDHNLSPESEFDTRFFTVTLSADGSVSTTDTGKIAAISSAEAQQYAVSLYEKGKTKGFVDCYRYQSVGTDDGGVMYVFVNCERELNTFRTFLIASIAISLTGLLLVFVLVVIFSGILMKPVAESYEKQKRFITDASHEIKTPLTIIDANTEVLEMTGGENQWTKSTRKQIARLTSLTEKLVFLSRMDEEATKTEMAEFALSEAVADTAEAFLPLAEARGKELSLSVQPDLHMVGNEGMIRQCVSLLLDNAVKYATENGQIRLTLRTQGKNTLLTVWNTAEGITSGRHDELFERFYRPDQSRNSKTGGHGIGLSVVYAIVKAHKGKITAKSDDGDSLQFTILF